VSLQRLRVCVERWPECDFGLYDPRCCRFPKSCSCTSYSAEYLKDGDLEADPATPRPETPLADCEKCGALICPCCSTHVFGAPPTAPESLDEGRLEIAAEAAHAAYEAAAPAHDYETRPETAIPWSQLPPQRKAHQRYATRAALTAYLRAAHPEEGAT